MSFSNGGGGTLALPSPTSLHGDAGPSVRSLRRSLSRSPSRFHLMRAESHNSQHSDSSSSSALPSPCPQPHTTTTSTTPAHAPPLRTSLSSSSSVSSFNSDYNFTSSTPLATAASAAAAPLPQQSQTGLFSTPLRSGVKLSLRSVRPKTASAKPVSRLRPSPKSPLKRALSTNSDLGNASPSTTPQSAGPSTALSEPLLGQENSSSGSSKFSSLLLALGSSPRNRLDKPSRHSMHLDLSGDSRLEALSSVISSPLKRSDAIMNLDQANPGSPVAKRRSLHGIASLGGEFNVFDFASPNTAPPARSSFEIHDDSSTSRDQPAISTPAIATSSSPAPAPAADPSSPFSAAAMTKRTSSLRKSTLQQRHDPRSSWGRRQGEKYLAQQQLAQQQLAQQQQAVPSSPQVSQQPKRSSNDWLFTAPGVRSKPRASLDQLLKPEPRDSPFKVKGPLANPSVHTVERPSGLAATHLHQPHPLSRTLTTSSSGSSMPDDSPTHFPVQLPPDRPRPTSIFARSLPLNAHRPRPDPIATPQYKAARPLQSVFASAGLVSKMNRNGEDESLQQANGRTMVMPDTPCKKQVYPSNTYPPSSGSGRKQQQRRFFFSAAPETPFSTGSGASQPQKATSTASENVANFFKRRSTHTRKGSILSIDGDISDSQGAVDGFDLPPTPTKSVLAKNLFGSASKGSSTPIAIRDLPTGPLSFTPDAAAPRRSPLPLSSPVGSLGSEKMSPKTPREHSILPTNDFSGSMAPPDASRLSISNNTSKISVTLPTNKSNAMIFPPATPTTDREAFANFVDRRVSITPVHGAAPNDTDVVLGSMFGKVECVGKGEFSQVFRVNTRDSSLYGRGHLDYFSATPSKRASARAESTTLQSVSASASAAPRVFAVKKVRLPYFGQKEREAKLREVAVLEAVRDRENVLQIYDHWEQNGHLYIQTEYCDEGGMDSFLKKAGEHGRLDDFRIWKILLEVSQGLRFVHDAGFIHLDLKPANIFVTYEGHLKIGDFGMASSWPAPKGIEGEGDREYMGPEILQGRYDKPADVFALGLIVLEIACNVFLPDNGPIWVALREGDMSVVPSLTAGEANALVRDSAGMPVVGDFDTSSQDGHCLTDSLDLASTTPGRNPSIDFSRPIHPAGNLFGSLSKKPIGLERPPAFMINASHPGSLDSVVSCLINPDPARRPTVHEILEIDSLQWVFSRRRAPATIFEGNWGPEDDDEGNATQTSSVEFDTEMMDV
ncbi:mitosis inhibitor protein kinase swe1 [Sporothrix bragantina]|uniref:Mitosis inhibitor protein kinase swe1 n=1 Tax=Sporothrix bragantina TaxID=671064 RepID=A0ABP0AX15_9PEZI